MRVDTKQKKITYHPKEREVLSLATQIQDENPHLPLATAAYMALSVLPRKRIHHLPSHHPKVPAMDAGFVYILSGGGLRLIEGVLLSNGSST